MPEQPEPEHHRWKFTTEITAVSTDDLAMKLEDLAHDLRTTGMRRPVFASPSCSGMAELTEIDRVPGR